MDINLVENATHAMGLVAPLEPRIDFIHPVLPWTWSGLLQGCLAFDGEVVEGKYTNMIILQTQIPNLIFTSTQNTNVIFINMQIHKYDIHKHANTQIENQIPGSSLDLEWTPAELSRLGLGSQRRCRHEPNSMEALFAGKN